ncbi:hypothetical protein [Pseudonocardia sp. N23]|uniref:hypothetical protein n=1 Tax=Pseudonocardia sp. N23 TaxID=1987376 RepID=UPI000C02E7E8|nr:hypothetical protein [Pseudonocardia sp. N23]GAY08387.1 hypothetical protein TOK_1944 [Pseudonocardia sp. N23]
MSSAGTTFNHDHRAETPDGAQQLPMLDVLRRDPRDGDAADGATRHFWAPS